MYYKGVHDMTFLIFLMLELIINHNCKLCISFKIRQESLFKNFPTYC